MVFPKEHPGYVHSHHRNIARFLVLLQQKQTGNITLSQLDAITGTQWRRFLLSGPTGIPSAAPTTFEAWLLSSRRSPMSRALLEDIQNFDSQDLSRKVSPVTPVVQMSIPLANPRWTFQTKLVSHVVVSRLAPAPVATRVVTMMVHTAHTHTHSW